MFLRTETMGAFAAETHDGHSGYEENVLPLTCHTVISLMNFTNNMRDDNNEELSSMFYTVCRIHCVRTLIISNML